MWSNNYEIDNEKWVFVHIPKTGGTTVRKILLENFFSFTTQHTVNVTTNVHRPISNKYSIKDVKYFTFLREPIDRCWSYFLMAKRDPFNPWHQHTHDVSTFFNHCWEVNNAMCQQIFGKVDFQIKQFEFDVSLKHLRQFKYVGQFESFNSSIINLLTNSFKLNTKNLQVPKTNETDKSKDIVLTDEYKKIIAQHNEYDIKLYRSFFNLNLL